MNESDTGRMDWRGVRERVLLLGASDRRNRVFGAAGMSSDSTTR